MISHACVDDLMLLSMFPMNINHPIITSTFNHLENNVLVDPLVNSDGTCHRYFKIKSNNAFY